MVCLIAAALLDLGWLSAAGVGIYALAWLRCLWAPVRDHPERLARGGLTILLLFGVPGLGLLGAVCGLIVGLFAGLIDETPLTDALWKMPLAGFVFCAAAVLVMALGQTVFWLRCRWFGQG